jgi:di/tricarboxylate transporter
VLGDSSLIGKSVTDAGLRHLDSLFLVEISRQNKVISPISPNELLKADDRLVFSGDVRQVSQIKQFDGVEIVVDSSSVSVENMTEVVVRPDSDLLNKTLKQADFRSKFNAAVIAFKRDGEALSGKLGEIKINAGDYLVLVTGHDFTKRQNVKKNFITLSGVEPNHKLTGKKQSLAIGGFLTAILLSAIGVVSLFKALVILFGLLMFTGCLNFQDIKQRLPFNIWLIVGSAIALSHGLGNTGVLSYVTSLISLELTLDNAFLFLIGIYLVTLILTELVTNNAAAALMFPLAYSIPLFYGIEPMPFILAVAFAASSSFISPYGYQTNLMVFNAGHYKLMDFVRAGVPVSITFSASVLYAIYLFYPIVKI